MVVELDAKSGTVVGSVAPPNTFDVVAELDAEPDAKSGMPIWLLDTAVLLDVLYDPLGVMDNIGGDIGSSKV